MKYEDEDNITLDELIKYHEEKRDAFNKLVIALQKDTEKKEPDRTLTKSKNKVVISKYDSRE